jgi:hypothetical protein
MYFLNICKYKTNIIHNLFMHEVIFYVSILLIDPSISEMDSFKGF